MTDPITVQIVEDDDEPRIRDIELAERLGYAEPRQIRKLILKYVQNLKEFSCVAIVPQAHPVNGAVYDEFWLTEDQAIFVTAKSGTEKAAEITVTVVRGFQEFRRLHDERLQLPQDYPEALRALATEHEAHTQTKERLALVEAKAGARTDKMSALAYCKWRGVELPRAQVGRLGRLANKHAKARGRRGEPVTDERYGSILIHDKRDLDSAWEFLFGDSVAAVA